MDGKAKNIDKTFLGSGGWGGGWAGGVRYMDPAVTGKFFYSHILKHILRKSAVVLSLDNKLKRFIPKCMSLKRKAVYTVQSKRNACAKSGVRSCCATRICKPPQEAKVPYFCRSFVIYLQELWNERSQKSSPQEATKLPQASRRRTKFLISVNLKEVCGVCRLFVTSFYSLDTNSLCGSRRLSCK